MWKIKTLPILDYWCEEVVYWHTINNNFWLPVYIVMFPKLCCTLELLGNLKKYILCLPPSPRHSNFFGVGYDRSIRFLTRFLGHSNVQQSLGITVLPVKTRIAYFLFNWHRTPSILCLGSENFVIETHALCRKGSLYRGAVLPEG